MKKIYLLALVAIFAFASMNASSQKPYSIEVAVEGWSPPYPTRECGAKDHDEYSRNLWLYEPDIYAVTLYGFVQTGIEPSYREAKAFSENLAAVRKRERDFVFREDRPKDKCKWGFIDISENWIIRAKYSDVQSFSNGLAAVKKSKKWGFIDKTGEWVIKPKYREVKSFSAAGLAEVKKEETWEVIDKKGTIVGPK